MAIRLRRGSLTSKKTSYKQEIKALTEISKAITSDRYLDDILKLIVTVTANVMDSKICSLWLLDEKEKVLKIRATQTMSEEYLKERSLRLGEGVVGYVAQTKKPLTILDVLKEPRYKEKELARKEGLVSMISVPLCVKEKVIGVINCYTSYPHQFSEAEAGSPKAGGKGERRPDEASGAERGGGLQTDSEGQHG